MGSWKEADAVQECPMLPVYSVQRDVGQLQSALASPVATTRPSRVRRRVVPRRAGLT